MLAEVVLGVLLLVAAVFLLMCLCEYWRWS